MRKRNIFNSRIRLNSNSRRRLMLKRVHQKVLLRRQQYQQSEMFSDIAQAS